MSSIIHELQTEAASGKHSVSDLLRKAKIVAVKLDLDEFLQWIESELNGYDVESEELLPDYRIVEGETKALNPVHGWQTIYFKQEKMNHLFSKRGVWCGIGELDDLVRSKQDNPLYLNLNPEEINVIHQGIQLQADVKFFIGKNIIAGILDKVRNIILDWSLKLEKAGILGEGITFTKADKEKAHSGSNTYNINNIQHFTGSIGDISGQSSVVATQITNTNDLKELLQLIEQIEKYKTELNLSEENYKKLSEEIEGLKESIRKAAPIKSTPVQNFLSSMKRIVEGAAGNVIAQGIVAGIQGFIV